MLKLFSNIIILTEIFFKEGLPTSLFFEPKPGIFHKTLRSEKETTNNIQELKAILYVMLNYGVRCDEWGQPPVVYSDSAYCVNTLNDWMFGWARRGWKKSDKQTPENLDLIQAYYDWYVEGYRIDLRKIKGHAGDDWNELADQLATGYITEEEAYATYN